MLFTVMMGLVWQGAQKILLSRFFELISFLINIFNCFNDDCRVLVLSVINIYVSIYNSDFMEVRLYLNRNGCKDFMNCFDLKTKKYVWILLEFNNKLVRSGMCLASHVSSSLWLTSFCLSSCALQILFRTSENNSLLSNGYGSTM